MSKLSLFKTTLLLGLYFIATRIIFIAMIVYPDTFIAFLIPCIISGFSSFLFLYFFDHKFKFAKKIKKNKMKTEMKLINHFIFLGSFTAATIIGFIGGPLFVALSTSLLLKNFRFKYIYVIFVGVCSTFLSLAIARGLFLEIHSIVLSFK
ncbi:hypothetical protein BH10PAT1_BH10PAT1_4120 [soil metagenome]